MELLECSVTGYLPYQPFSLQFCQIALVRVRNQQHKQNHKVQNCVNS